MDQEMNDNLEDRELFKAAMFKIADAELAYEEPEEKSEEAKSLRNDVIKRLFEEVRSTLNQILDKELAAAGRDILQDTLKDLKLDALTYDDDEAGNENAQEFKFEKLWRWCYEISLKIGEKYEWDDERKRMKLN